MHRFVTVVKLIRIIQDSSLYWHFVAVEGLAAAMLSAWLLISLDPIVKLQVFNQGPARQHCRCTTDLTHKVG